MTVSRSTGNQKADPSYTVENTSWMSMGFATKLTRSFPYKWAFLTGAVACLARLAFVKFYGRRGETSLPQQKNSFSTRFPRPFEIEWAEYREQILAQPSDKPLPSKRYKLKRYKLQAPENL